MLPTLPNEPHVPTVGLADEEVHVEVGEVHFRYSVVAAEKLPNSMKPLYLRVLILDVLLVLRKSTQPRILMVPFFGKKGDQRPSEIPGGSSLKEPILG